MRTITGAYSYTSLDEYRQVTLPLRHQITLIVQSSHLDSHTSTSLLIPDNHHILDLVKICTSVFAYFLLILI